MGAVETAAFRDLAQSLRAASWDIALGVVEHALERELIPSYAPLGTVQRLANLPAFIGGLAMAITRPAPGPHRATNPILTRLARDHVIERERIGFSAREIVQEFLLLRRVMWQHVQLNLEPSLAAPSVLRLEDLLNSILDEVIAECTVTYFDRATHELSERSRRDSLTGLLNHQAFNTRLDEEIDRARRYGGELQVIYVDLDDFKNINDDLGHPEGDRALIGLAQIIQDSIRDSDFAGRIGGDEFVIGLVETTDMAAHLLLDRLRERVALAVAQDVVPVGTRLSAGCAGLPTEADTAQDLLVLADRRLYEDKHARQAARAAGVQLDPVMTQGSGVDGLVETDPETRRIVEAAREAIDAARRMASDAAPSQQ
jgi:diguanylate cyclase (GGDEF)-like protein